MNDNENEYDEELVLIIENLGHPDEELDDELLDDLLEELDALESSINDDELFNQVVFNLCIASIELGKWQILEHVLDSNEFSPENIKKLKKSIKNYLDTSEDDYCKNKMNQILNSLNDERELKNWTRHKAQLIR